MTHAITLEVSQDLFNLLVEKAGQQGQPPEVLAAEWLAAASQYLASDPLESLIGTLETDVHDWAERHDQLHRSSHGRRTTLSRMIWLWQN